MLPASALPKRPMGVLGAARGLDGSAPGKANASVSNHRCFVESPALASPIRSGSPVRMFVPVAS